MLGQLCQYYAESLTIDDRHGAFQGRAVASCKFPVHGLPASPVELIVMCRHDHGQMCDYYEAKQRIGRPQKIFRGDQE